MFELMKFTGCYVIITVEYTDEYYINRMWIPHCGTLLQYTYMHMRVCILLGLYKIIQLLIALLAYCITKKKKHVYHIPYSMRMNNVNTVFLTFLIISSNAIKIFLLNVKGNFVEENYSAKFFQNNCSAIYF